jgi:hypothetical protein
MGMASTEFRRNGIPPEFFTSVVPWHFHVHVAWELKTAVLKLHRSFSRLLKSLLESIQISRRL